MRISFTNLNWIPTVSYSKCTLRAVAKPVTGDWRFYMWGGNALAIEGGYLAGHLAR